MSLGPHVYLDGKLADPLKPIPVGARVERIGQYSIYYTTKPTVQNGLLEPVNPVSGKICDQVDTVAINFTNFDGQQIDTPVSLGAPATLLAFTMCGGGAGPTMLLAGWVSFKPLNLTPVALTDGLPVGVQGLPISHFQRAFQTGVSNMDLSTARDVPQHPIIKFCKPITKFYLTMWGIDAMGALVTDGSESLTIISSVDLEDFVSYPTPKQLTI